jgi:hypothetical protein
VRRDFVIKAMTAFRHECIPKHEAPDPIGNLFGQTRNDRTAIGMTSHNKIAKVLTLDLLYQVFDLLRVIDVFFYALAVAQDGRCNGAMPLGFEMVDDRSSVFPGMPGPMDKNKIQHGKALLMSDERTICVFE